MATQLRKEQSFNSTGGKCCWCQGVLTSWSNTTEYLGDARKMPTVEHIFCRRHPLRRFVPFKDIRTTLACYRCNSKLGGSQSKRQLPDKMIQTANKLYLKLNEKPELTKTIKEHLPKIQKIVRKQSPQFRLVIFGSFLGRRLIDYYLKHNQIECADDYHKYQKIQSKEFADFISECGLSLDKPK